MGRTLLEILHRGDEHREGMPREEASRALDRYELARAAEQTFASLSGGQQARFQILLLELSGATLLLLDEPTDNLDLESAEALEEGLEAFDGTVVAVTHDRWFARGFDRFLVFGASGRVYESPEAVWDEGRVDTSPLERQGSTATCASPLRLRGDLQPGSAACVQPGQLEVDLRVLVQTLDVAVGELATHRARDAGDERPGRDDSALGDDRPCGDQ